MLHTAPRNKVKAAEFSAANITVEPQELTHMRPLRVSVVIQPTPFLSEILKKEETLNLNVGKKDRDMFCTVVLLFALFCLVN